MWQDTFKELPMTAVRADLLENGVTADVKPGLAEVTWPGMGYVYHATFASPKAEQEYFSADAKTVHVPKWVDFIRLLEADEMDQLPAVRSLSAADERTLFLRYNYARFRLSKLVERRRRGRAEATREQIDLWHARVMRAQSDLVGANMGLVPAMARRSQIPTVEFDELISEGNMALLRCLDKFDVSRGYKFSTYACSAILKAFHRLARKSAVYRQRFPGSLDPLLERPDIEGQAREVRWADSIDWVRSIVDRNRADLSDLERRILNERFALTSRGQGRTLMEIARLVGLSTERVRQLLNRALQKIHEVMDRDVLVA